MRTYEKQLQRMGNMLDPLLIEANLANSSINLSSFHSLPNNASNMDFPFNIGSTTTNTIANTLFSIVNFPNSSNTNNVVNDKMWYLLF